MKLTDIILNEDVGNRDIYNLDDITLDLFKQKLNPKSELYLAIPGKDSTASTRLDWGEERNNRDIEYWKYEAKKLLGTDKLKVEFNPEFFYGYKIVGKEAEEAEDRLHGTMTSYVDRERKAGRSID